MDVPVIEMPGTITSRRALGVFILDERYLFDNCSANLNKSDRPTTMLQSRLIRTFCLRLSERCFLLVTSAISRLPS